MVVGKKFGVAAVAAVAVVTQAPVSSAVPTGQAALVTAAVAGVEGGSPEVRAMARALETGAPVEVAELTDERTKVVADPERASSPPS